MIVGRDGQTLSEKWETEGTKTFLGLHTRGFPNFLIMTGRQGGGGTFNFTDAIDVHGDYVVWMLSNLRARGGEIVDVAQEFEERYARHCQEADISTAPLRDCLSYYNGHGTAQPGSLAYYGGTKWHDWRREAQDTLLPYEFGRAAQNEQRAQSLGA
jgi:cyclohexanone monooxygenase